MSLMNSDWSNYKSAPQFSTLLCFTTASKVRYLSQRSRTSRLLSPAKVNFTGLMFLVESMQRNHPEGCCMVSMFFHDFVSLFLGPEGLYVIGQSRKSQTICILVPFTGHRKPNHKAIYEGKS